MTNRYQTLLERSQKEIPKLKVLTRGQSWLMKFLFFFLSWNKKDYSQFATTIFRTIYVPDSWDSWTSDDQYKLFRHELQHLRQFRSWPFKILARPYLWWINAIIMGLCYLVVLPAWWTFRAKFEREGYTQTLLVTYELGGLRDGGEIAWWIQRMVENFSGPSYCYMDDAKSAKAWAEKTVYQITSGTITNDKDRVDDK